MVVQRRIALSSTTASQGVDVRPTRFVSDKFIVDDVDGALGGANERLRTSRRS
jgi:hypothetical protein